MGSKIAVQIERALLGKSSDVGISALGIDSGRMTGKPSLIPVREGLPTIRSESHRSATDPYCPENSTIPLEPLRR